MSRPALFLLISVKTGKMPFRIVWPIPLFILWMLLDIAADLAAAAALLPVRSHPEETGEKQFAVRFRSAVLCAEAVLREALTISGPQELVCVETERTRFRLSVL